VQKEKRTQNTKRNTHTHTQSFH